MKEKAFKYLPIVIGLMLGWLLTHPPQWLPALGPARHLATAALVALTLMIVAAITISANLPSDVSLDPLPDTPLPPEVSSLAERLQAIGFRSASPLLKVGINPSALLLALVDEKHQTYATAFRTGTVPAKTSFEFVSTIEGDRGGLNSSAEPSGTCHPARTGSFTQVFPRQPLEQVYERHREAVAFLRARGLSMKPVSAAAFPGEFKASLARQRRAFLAAPLRMVAVLLWRAVTNRTPHLGPIQAQKHADRQIQELTSGRRS